MSLVVHFSPITELARILVAAARSDTAGICSVDDLSQVAGMSRRSFQNRCQAVGVRGRDCLHFVQCLKPLLSSDGTRSPWDPVAWIPVGDPRTLRNILKMAGLNGAERPTIAAFVARQQFLSNEWLKESVLTELNKSSGAPSRAETR